MLGVGAGGQETPLCTLVGRVVGEEGPESSKSTLVEQEEVVKD